jgi:hypothetical protein
MGGVRIAAELLYCSELDETMGTIDAGAIEGLTTGIKVDVEPWLAGADHEVVARVEV